jgi:lipoprotein-releasing system permease protein
LEPVLPEPEAPAVVAPPAIVPVVVPPETTPVDASVSPPPPQEPARRSARLAAAFIDAGTLLILPLVPSLVLFFLRRPDLALLSGDEYLNLVEGSAAPIAKRLLGTGWSGPLSLGLPVVVFVVLQWVGVALRGQTLGQHITGIRWTRRGGRPGIGAPIARTVLIAAGGLGVAWALRQSGHEWPLGARLSGGLGLLWLLDGLPALTPSRLTIRDRLLSMRVLPTRPMTARAFVPPRFSSVAFLLSIAGIFLSAGTAAVLYALVSRSRDLESTDIDVPAVVAGAAIPLGLVLTGAFAAYKSRRFVVGELSLVGLLLSVIAFEGMLWGLLPVPALQQFMVPGLVDWIVYAMCGYFGAVVFLVIGSALGFMVSSDEGPDFSTRFERLVARRHLRLKLEHWVMLAFIATLAPIVVYGIFIWPVRAVRRLTRGESVKRPLPPTVFMSLLTIVGVMFGVTSLTVVLGVMGGFERDLKDKILGTTAHGLVMSYLGNFSDWREVQKKIQAVPGVAGATPYIYGEVMITTENAATGAVLHGVDPETISTVTDLNKSIANKGDGRLSDLIYPDRIPRHAVRHSDELPATRHDADVPNGGPADDDVLPGIAIGVEMAHGMNVWVGDRVTVMNPMGELGPQGPVPRSRAFRVAAVFKTGMFEYDSKFAYIDLMQAQKFFRLGDAVSGIELRFTNVDEARPLMRRIITALGDFPYRGKDWGQMNANLFSALRLERVVMFVLLSFQVLIACICVIATLVMLVIEKRKEVATLKAMGARESSIMKLFVIEGLIIGGIGTFYGSATGFLFCKLIEKFGVGLNPEIYYIDKLPVVIEPSAFIAVAAVAMLLVFVATIYPARRGGSIAPVEGFREE